MEKTDSINWISACFDDPEREKEFQAFAFRRNLRSNIVGVLIGIVLIALYAFAEFVDSPAPSIGIVLRAAIVLVAATLLISLFNKHAMERREIIFVVIATLMGAATNLNIYLQPTLDNTFYLGIIQGYIMFSLLLRLKSTSIASMIIVTQLTFMAIVFSKHDIQNAILQSANTFVIGLICIAGVYLLQRFQREDFLKSRTIEDQNKQLRKLLTSAERDNERKIAALNLLVHFVKTPLHQINGFSDLLVSSLASADNIENEQCKDSARYIKQATTDLSRSVNNLLEYHRLDEFESVIAPEAISVATTIDDFEYAVEESVDVTTKRTDAKCLADVALLRVTFDSLARYYANPKTGAQKLSISIEQDNQTVSIILEDDGNAKGRASFEEDTKPLTEIDNYLTSAGDRLPMALRTAHRALALSNCEFTFEECETGNRLIIVLPAAPTSNKLVAA